VGRFLVVNNGAGNEPATGPHTGRIRPVANRWLQHFLNRSRMCGRIATSERSKEFRGGTRRKATASFDSARFFPIGRWTLGIERLRQSVFQSAPTREACHHRWEHRFAEPRPSRFSRPVESTTFYAGAEAAECNSPGTGRSHICRYKQTAPNFFGAVAMFAGSSVRTSSQLRSKRTVRRDHTPGGWSSCWHPEQCSDPCRSCCCSQQSRSGHQATFDTTSTMA
jgi:hypothetical protein